jgi:hypothetical protein
MIQNLFSRFKKFIDKLYIMCMMITFIPVIAIYLFVIKKSDLFDKDTKQLNWNLINEITSKYGYFFYKYQHHIIISILFLYFLIKII